MPVKILQRSNQAVEYINNGEIEENKTVGVSANKNIIRPYSDIFYFSGLWTDIGSCIAEHSHKGFEIITYVIKGSIEHHWENGKVTKINAGDIEHLKSGTGIKHVEKYSRNTKAIQIWLDPNLRNSLAKKSELKLLEAGKIKLIELTDHSTNLFIGKGGMLESDLEETEIKEDRYAPGLRSYKVKEGRYLTGYIIKGEIELENRFLKENDFFIIKDEMDQAFYVLAHTRILLIDSPVRPSYKTYLELRAEASR